MAARSYVEASPLGYGGYADTCDQFCQSYPGMRWETATSLLAADDTAGQVMMVNGTSTVATTEYSASSGGYTTGRPVPRRAGRGRRHLHTAGVQSQPRLDRERTRCRRFRPPIRKSARWCRITVTRRNGLGDLGGRVEQMTIAGTSGDGDRHRGRFRGQTRPQVRLVRAERPAGRGRRRVLARRGPTGECSRFGNARFFGSMGGVPLNQPVVGMSATHDSGGYWEVASDGGIFSFGDAEFYGSTGQPSILNRPVVGMATTPDGGGYWLVASDGGVFCFGDAPFEGSVPGLLKPGQSLNAPIVGIVPTRDGRGYWLVASDGGVFAFGDAGFVGSLGSSPPPTPIVGVAPTPDNGGYWLLEADGVAHAFGDAPGVGISAASPGLGSRTSAMTAPGGRQDRRRLRRGRRYAARSSPTETRPTSPTWPAPSTGTPGHVVGIADTPG